MSTLTIIQGNSNDKDNTRAYMVKGERGDDGISPTFETSKTGHTATITITDAEGTHTVTLTDGVSPTVETSKTGGVTTITITDEDGTHTATINDGQTYEVPAGSIIGFDGNTIPAGYEEVASQFLDTFSNSTTNGYTCNYINSLTTYSATEKRIGTWTNNKPLYRSTITFQSTTSPFQYSHGISNIDQIVNFYGYHVRGSETTCRPLQAYNLAYPNYYVSIDSISKTQVELFAGDSVKSSLNWTITIEYTKTTD